MVLSCKKYVFCTIIQYQSFLIHENFENFLQSRFLKFIVDDTVALYFDHLIILGREEAERLREY